MNKYIIAALLCTLTAATYAGKHDIAADKELSHAFQAIKTMDGYAYRFTVVQDTSYQPATTVRIPVQKTTCYASMAGFIQYVATEGTVYLVNNTGMFRTYGSRKTVLYHLFRNDSDRDANRTLLLAVDGAQLLDSVLLHDAQIATRKVRHGELQYHLTYPDNSMIRSMDVTLGPDKNFITMVRYVVERRLSRDANAPVVRQVATIDHYEHRMPDELTLMLAAMGNNMEAYLKQAYPGYKVQLF